MKWPVSIKKVLLNSLSRLIADPSNALNDSRAEFAPERLKTSIVLVVWLQEPQVVLDRVTSRNVAEIVEQAP